MSDNIEMDFDPSEKLPIQDFAEKAYLEYSMYVILDRALPNIGDGLKTSATSNNLCDVRIRAVCGIQA